MLPQSSHITRKKGLYFFRRRVPRCAATEVTLSLRTRSFREAQWLAALLSREFDRIVREMPNHPDIAKVLRDYLKINLQYDMELRRESNGVPVYARPGSSALTSQQLDLRWLDQELERARTQLANRRYDDERSSIDALMSRVGLPEEARTTLSHGILQADVELLEIIRERTLGRFPSLLADEPSSNALTKNDKTATDNSPLFSIALSGFLDVMSKDGKWRGQTLAQSKASYRLCRDVCGDHPIQSYARPNFSELYHVLRRLPANYSKAREYRGKSTKEIAEAADKSNEPCRMSMITMKRHFAALSRFFGYLIEHGLYEGENPAEGFNFSTKGRANERRQMWEGDKLKALFSSPIWAGCKSEHRLTSPGELVIQDEKFWLPILGLFHGNRLEEFAQLRREDVRLEGGIWYFDVNNSGERQLKNAQSKRRIPVHPEVLRLGFIDYVMAETREPSDLVFPSLKPGGPDNKLGYYFTKWWSRYRKKVGVYEEGLDYHSFRHGVTSKLFEAQVHEAQIDQITGHEGKSTSSSVYLKKLSLPLLHDALAKVTWPEVAGLLREYQGKRRDGEA